MTKTTQGGIFGGRHHRPAGGFTRPGRTATAPAHPDDAPTETIAAVEESGERPRGVPIDRPDAPGEPGPEGRIRAMGPAMPSLPRAVGAPGGGAPAGAAVTRPVVGAPVAGAPAVRAAGAPPGRGQGFGEAPDPEKERPAAEEEPASGPHDVEPDDDPDEETREAPTEARFTRSRARLAIGIAAVVVFGLIAWSMAGATGSGDDAPPPPPDRAAPVMLPAFGEQITIGDGWALMVSEPAKANVDLPSDVARAVRFEVTVTNGADRVRDSGIWTVKATVDGRPVTLLDDEGGLGHDVPSRTVRPGSSLQFPVIVPMPKEKSDVQVEFAAGAAAPVLFVGPA